MLDPRVKSAWACLDRARRRYQRRKTPLDRHDLTVARRRYTKIKRLVKLQRHISYCNKLESGRIALLFEARRTRLRPPSTRDSRALSTEAAETFWQQQFRSPTDEDISAWAPMATDLSELNITTEMVALAIAGTRARTPDPDGLDARLLRSARTPSPPTSPRSSPTPSATASPPSFTAAGQCSSPRLRRHRLTLQPTAPSRSCPS